MSNEQDWYSGGWFPTFTGKVFFPLDPRIEDICIDDIAHALSNISRYGGHCRKFYSVAQHCCMVSDWIPEFKLEGLMHDSAEAYLGDVIRPIKHSPGMEPYREAEHRLEGLIHIQFDLDMTTETAAFVKHYDNRALFTERKYLLTTNHSHWANPVEPLPVEYLIPWTSEQAEEEFLERYYTLQRRRVSL
jgi:hypothetical protein